MRTNVIHTSVQRQLTSELGPPTVLSCDDPIPGPKDVSRVQYAFTLGNFNYISSYIYILKPIVVIVNQSFVSLHIQKNLRIC